MKLLSLLVLACAAQPVVSSLVLAAETLPTDIARWGLPTSRDIEVNPYWDQLGEEKKLPETLHLRLQLQSRMEFERFSPPVRGPLPWIPEVSRPYWVVPSSQLPPEVHPMASNNNVAIVFHEGRLFMAWRTAPSHFASAKTRMYLVSSSDFGRSWDLEHELALGSDVREPCFLSFKGHLIFSFFEAGTNPVLFEPKHLFRIERIAQGKWTEPEQWGEDGEIAWEIKVRDGRAWATTYTGNHYSAGKSHIEVHFKVSDDGLNWRDVNESHPAVFTGGVSESGWEFDNKGDLWAVLRNEDGDSTGFGSYVAHAPASDLSAWETAPKTDPHRYDSPRMFRHGEDLYLVARRDVGGPFDKGWNWLPFSVRKALYLVSYSLRAKHSALYWIDRVHGKVVWLQDLPGDGDTAFPSVVQTGPDSWLLANYTSPLRYPRRSWIWGQISPQGTQIYFTEISFKAPK